MASKIKEVAYRVVIEPRRLGDFGSVSMPDRLVCRDESHMLRQYKERCEDMLDQIKRHVDNVGSATVESDTERFCEHCGRPWTEKSDEYNGGCCSKDQESQDARDAEHANSLLSSLGFPKTKHI